MKIKYINSIEKNKKKYTYKKSKKLSKMRVFNNFIFLIELKLQLTIKLKVYQLQLIIC